MGEESEHPDSEEPEVPSRTDGRPDDLPSPSAPPLRPMRHRQVALMRAAALVALTCGPLALVVSWAAPSPSVHASGPAARQPATFEAQSPQDQGGFAEVFLGLWLRGGQSGETKTAAQEALRTMAPEVPLPEFGGRPPRVAQVRAVRSVPVGPGAWSVTVAVDLDGKQPAYFSVPVVGGGRGQAESFVVSAAPARVGGPPARKVPASPYTAEVTPGSALSTTARQFLSAYLGGSDDAERYLAPHAVLPPLGSSYAAVRAERVTSIGSADGAVGRQGQEVRVRVQVTARDARGAQWPLTYALRLAARDGRWEVLAVESGLEGVKASTSKDGE
ncbi:conjugal transfer protein [Streptomyces kronopolitis]|uniref:conjugal transfer protein n=1 Tax=Streptomyces kronopolitis TaxID=1612435 RepID=UPI0036970D75